MSLLESTAELVARLERERQQPSAKHKHFPVAVSGGRDYQPTAEELAAFWRIWDRLGATELHHGDCNREKSLRIGRPTGVDQVVAAEVRRTRPQIKITPHPADWFPPEWDPARGPYRPAGPKRNQEMAVVCLALIHFPGGRGTQGCRDIFRRAGRLLCSILDELVLMDSEKKAAVPPKRGS